MIVTTEAIVLRTMKYRDTSRIATLFCSELGKISVIAKGERMRAARYGGSLGVLSRIQAVIYWKEHRDLQLLSRSELRQAYGAISSDMERMAAAMLAVELLDAVVHAQEKNPPLFVLLEETLDAINLAPHNILSVLYYYELHLLRLLGFDPNLEVCCRCGGPLVADDLDVQMHVLNASSGGAYCAACSDQRVGFERVSAGALRVLRYVQEQSRASDAARLAVSPPMRREVERILHQLLVSHVEGLRPLKAEGVFASLLG